MKLKEEIRKIAEYQNSQLPKPEKRSEIAFDAIVEKALAAQKNNTLDFSKLIHIRIKQADKLRKINAVKEAFAHCGLSIPYFLKGV